MKLAAERYDIAIVGSGFAGSLLAMIARRAKRRVVVLEKFKHPRFAIGESSTPLANLLLEELAARYDLPRLRPLTKWGTWQDAYPHVGCGLKRGFSFYHHDCDRERGDDDPERKRQLLVAASPHDRIADTHWYRPDFDHFLLDEARNLGAVYHDQVTLDAPARTNDGHAWSLGGRAADGAALGVEARLIVDATGPRGFLHKRFKLGEAEFPHLPATQSLYAHFAGVRRFAETAADVVACGEEEMPYPVDDAALHHVFDGGWMWVLRFNNGVTSAGFAVVDRLAAELRLDEGKLAWRRLLRRLPAVAAQFAEAEPVTPFVYARRLPFRSGTIAGPDWALLPSAAGFVDPLLSTGFPLTLLGVTRLGGIIHEHLDDENLESRLKIYAAETRGDLLAAEQLIAALYANMRDFEVFAALTLLYFAAASFAESARRLNRPQLAASFLLRSHPTFGPLSRKCLERALRLGGAEGAARANEKNELIGDVRRAIAPIDVAGLSDFARRNWYPARADDLLDAAGKLGVERGQIQRMLERSNFIA